MPLYQNSVLKKYLKQQDSEAVAKAFKKFTKYFHDPKIQENIRSSKEEEYQGIFLTELFSKILGYTMKPNANFNLVAEYKNEKNSRKADGAILKDNEALGVIELKGTNTKDLEKVRQQAFDYKANQTGCVYVITSNFEKIRFYINNAVDFEEFDLFNLNQERFELLYLCLAQENLLNNVPLKIKEASVQEEEAITKKFYTDYSTFKRELFRDLVKLNMKNEVFRAELNIEDAERANKNIKHNLFKKSQKLIDRFLFIFFAEDRGLLPPNSTVKILEQWNKLKELDEVVPLYSRYKKYFNYLDTGRKGTDKTAEIFAYNGGLFKPDPVLDSLIISDELLAKHTNALQAYDFESQVDVNILGHIFENSLNEIESVNAEIEETDFDKQTSKRKKDGVFYTPKYITKYIVDNTVGKLCNEKKTELGIIEEEYLKSRKGRSKTKLKELLDSLETYREWLLHITILDPACGSGAFLNQALDFLIKEHQYIDELQTNLLGGGFVFPDIENTVLENNIFGVDLNEESVEIAKLSLWLRTAQPRRKLNNLSSNIKCGNSLIDSKSFAGDKAFKWEDEFVHVFEKGGFDVVIGNPPYVQHRRLTEFSDFFKNKYEVYTGTSDLSVYFYEKGIKLLKKNGMFAYINTNKFFNSEYGKKLRDFLVRYEIIEILNFEQVSIFKGALVSSTINVLRNNNSEAETNYIEFKKEKLEINTFDIEIKNRTRKITKEYLKNNSWTFENKLISVILSKIKSQGTALGDMEDINIKRGITTGFDDAFLLKRNDSINIQYPEISKKILRGKDIGRYVLNNSDLNLLFIPWHFPLHDDDTISGASVVAEEQLNSTYPKLYTHLLTHKEKLEARNKTETGIRYEWYVLQRCAASYYKLFDEEKIVWGLITGNWGFSIDTEKHYLTSASFFLTSKNLNLKLLLLLLNSRLYKFYFENVGELTAGGAYVLKKTSVEKFIYPTNARQVNIEIMTSYGEKIIQYNYDLNQYIKSVCKYLISQFSNLILTTKLQNWNELEFGDFIKELNKAIKKVGGEKLTKMDEMDWMEVFETKKTEAQTLKAEIDKTDAEIDAMVYELYGLSEEEIHIVENN